MAGSAASVARIGTTLGCRMFRHVAGGTSAVILTDGTYVYYIPAANAAGIRVGVIATAITTGFTKLEIIDGSDPTVVKEKVIALDAVQKQDFLEVIADEIKAAAVTAGKDLPYVTARLTAGNASDAAVVVFMQAPMRFGGQDLILTGLPVLETNYTT
jgi:hypothetical protein